MRKVLLIGLGRWGQIHLKTWRQLAAERPGEIELLIADSHEPLLAKARAEGACETAADYRALLDKADVVDIVTPAPSHFELGRACLEAGKDVHVEKPLCATAAESYALAEIARKSARLLQVGHVFRFEPAVEAVKDILSRGTLGPLLYMTAHFQSFKRPRTDGGAAISDGVHFADLACHLLGRAPRAVTATTRDFLGRGMEDVSLLTLDFGREVAHIEAAYFPGVKKRDLEVLCEGGSLFVDFLGAKDKVLVWTQRHTKKGEEWGATEAPPETVQVKAEEPLKRELASFLRCVETRSTPLADGIAGALAVAIIEAAFRSAREGCTVPLAT